MLLVCVVPLLIGLRLPQSDFDGIIPRIGIVCAVVVNERRSALPSLRWLGKLGDASYSIYLMHIFTLGALRVAWVQLPPGSLGAASFAQVSMSGLSGPILAHSIPGELMGGRASRNCVSDRIFPPEDGIAALAAAAERRQTGS